MGSRGKGQFGTEEIIPYNLDKNTKFKELVLVKIVKLRTCDYDPIEIVNCEVTCDRCDYYPIERTDVLVVVGHVSEHVLD